MAISLTNAQTSSGSGTAITVTKPTGGSPGDLLLIIINHNDELKTIADNNGSTPCTQQIDINGALGSGGLAVWYRFVGASEPASYAFTFSGSDRWTIVACILHNAHSTKPFDVNPADGSDEAASTTPTCPGVTTLTNFAWAIAAAGTDGTGNGGTFTAGPTGYTEIGTVNVQQPLSVFYKEIPVASATGDQDFTITTAGGGVSYTLSIFAIPPSLQGAMFRVL